MAKKQGAEASPDSRYFDAQNGGATATGAAPGGFTGALDLTTPGSTVGTAAYMSPEQAKGEPLDARTDLFSLGSVLYEMATGHAAFTGRSTAEVFVALLTKEPPSLTSLNPAMPAALDAVVTRLLAKERDQRYRSAEELLADLEAISLSPGNARPASSPSRSGGGSRRSRPSDGRRTPYDRHRRPAARSGRGAALPLPQSPGNHNRWPRDPVRHRGGPRPGGQAWCRKRCHHCGRLRQ